jgi:hypothetical protein
MRGQQAHFQLRFHVAYDFVFHLSFLSRLNKLNFSQQAQVTLKLAIGLSDLVKTF